jgi:hypothetical protein
MDSLTKTEPGVTAALVDRVAERVATGVPLVHALAGEPLSLEDYEERLREHPDLAAMEGVAKRKFIQKTVGILLSAKDSSANIRWLLERLYPEVFGLRRERGQDEVAVEVSASTSAVTGMSMEYLRA